MAFPSRKEAYDSNTSPNLSSRTSMNGAQYRRSTKWTTSYSQSYRGSISNSSVHTTSTAATREGLFDNSENGTGGVPSTSHRKSFHSLEKSTFLFRNQSQSTLGTIRDAGSARSSTITSTSKQGTCLLNIPSLEDGDESPLPFTPRSSAYELSTLPEFTSPISSHNYSVPPSASLDDPSTKEGKANDTDIVKLLQQICRFADPTQLYRNLVKIGQG